VWRAKNVDTLAFFGSLRFPLASAPNGISRVSIGVYCRVVSYFSTGGLSSIGTGPKIDADDQIPFRFGVQNAKQRDSVTPSQRTKDLQHDLRRQL
jgi:hypothetical protein